MAKALEGQNQGRRKPRPPKANPWRTQSTRQPLLSVLFARLPDDTQDATKFRLAALKGMLLAAYYSKNHEGLDFKELGDLDSKELGDLCSKIRLSYSPKEGQPLPSFNSLTDSLIPGPEQRENWLEALAKNMKECAPKPRFHVGRGGQLYPAEFNWLSDLRKLSQILSGLRWSDVVSEPNNASDLIVQTDAEDDEDVDETGRPAARQSRRLIQEVTERTATADVAAEALNPESQSAVELESVLSGEEMPVPQATTLEVRHTNWKTSREAQRLPWDWRQLNSIEIGILTGAIAAASPDSGQPSGAALAWLLLVTGKHLDDVLAFPWLSDKPWAISPQGHWIRAIPVPPKAFAPKTRPSGLLEHTGRAVLKLPCPFPRAIEEAFDRSVRSASSARTVGEALGVDAADADLALRGFLGGIRSANNRYARLQPGRIRRVLANTVMQITQDKVLTHLIAGLPHEEPPTGVYYTAYPLRVIQNVYRKAMQRIFR